MPASHLGPYVPAGSYQQTSRGIRITLTALCRNVNDEWKQSRPLRYSETDTAGLRDIVNENGALRLSRGSGRAGPAASPFVPAGSYLDTSREVRVTIEASGQTAGGVDQPPTMVTFAAHLALEGRIKDIANQDGKLVVIT